MPNFNRFTIKAQEALQRGQELAAEHNQGELKALHLLASLLADEQSLVTPALTRSNINIESLRDRVEGELARLPKLVSISNVSQLYLSQELMKVLDHAGRVAVQQKDEFVSCEHLLLAVADVPSSAKSILEEF